MSADSKEGMRVQHGRSYAFFGAPVGLMFTIIASLEQGSWLDYGMFIHDFFGLMGRAALRDGKILC